MFLLRNAIKNIYRYRSKYILIGIVLLIIVLIASIQIGIFNYTSMTTDALKTKYAGAFRISKDTSYITQQFNKADFEWFSELDYVERVDFNSYIMSTKSMGHIRKDITEDHKRVMAPEEYEEAINRPPVAKVELTVKEDTYVLQELSDNEVYIMGYTYDTLRDDQKARFVIENGRMYETDNECVITQNPLLTDEKWNLLGIGDTIKISKDTGVSKEYTVVGILKSAENLTEETKTRILYTTFDSAADFGKATIANTYGNEDGKPQGSSGLINHPLDTRERPTLGIEEYEVVVILKSHEYFNTFLRYLPTLNEGYYGSSLYENYTSILGVLNQSYMWSVIFIVIITIILVFMTVFTTIFNLNSRKYEIAVLRSVGMKKGQLIMSYLVENLMFVWGITAVALIVSQITEPLFINRIFEGIHTLLSPELFDEFSDMAGFPLLVRNAVIVFGGMTVTVLLSLLLICINIVRFQPLKIFNKQY